MKVKDIDNLPITSGVYKFYDSNHQILYVGKANNLRNRVKSYFNEELYDRPFVKQMIPFIDDIEIIKTNNEIESLVLESALIKKYKPKYNSDLKDDKSYAWIYISTKDVFPTVRIVRKVSTEDLKKGRLFGPYPNGRAIKRIFTYLRKLYPFCTCSAKTHKECLYYHLELCPGPYQGHISKEEYRKNINEIIKFLEGRKRGHLDVLEKEMKMYSQNMDYEKAGVIRDKLNDLKYLGEKIDYEYGDTEESYSKRRKEALMSNFHDLKIELGLKKLNRIECYDISNISGLQAYGSMTVAQDGEIVNSQYRIFRIKTLNMPNDPEMLREVLARRFENPEKYPEYPDIVLIDGGKSQLSTVHDKVPENITLLGISKGKRLKRAGQRMLDEFWIYDREAKEVKQIRIKNKRILIELRDEAHRFAILHHRKARIKESKSSKLLDIDGVGRTRRINLLKKFKNVENIKKASFEEINAIVKNRSVSMKIMEYFNTSGYSEVSNSPRQN